MAGGMRPGPGLRLADRSRTGAAPGTPAGDPSPADPAAGGDPAGAGRVVYVVDDAGQPVLLEAWVPARTSAGLTSRTAVPCPWPGQGGAGRGGAGRRRASRR